MSPPAMAFVLKTHSTPGGRYLTAVERHILMSVAWRHNHDYHCAWPKQEGIVADTHLSDRQVTRALLVLEDEGVLHVTNDHIPMLPGQETDGRRRRGNIYRFIGLDPIPEDAKPRPRPSAHRKGRPDSESPDFPNKGDSQAPDLPDCESPDLPDSQAPDRRRQGDSESGDEVTPSQDSRARFPSPPLQSNTKAAAAPRVGARPHASQPGTPGTPTAPSAPPPPPELLPVDEILRSAPGYDPDEDFYTDLAAFAPVLDLEREAKDLVAYVAERPGKRAPTRFILDWLRRSQRDPHHRRPPKAATAVTNGQLVPVVEPAREPTPAERDRTRAFLERQLVRRGGGPLSEAVLHASQGLFTPEQLERFTAPPHEPAQERTE